VGGSNGAERIGDVEGGGWGGGGGGGGEEIKAWRRQF